MAYAYASIKTAIAELLEGTIGATRTISSGVFAEGVFDGQRLSAQQAATLDTATASYRFDVVMTPAAGHDSAPAHPISNTTRMLLSVTIPMWGHLGTTAEISARATARGAFEDALDEAASALAFRGNLRQTSASVNTGLLGGVLTGPGGSGLPEVDSVQEDREEHLLRSQINASAVVTVMRTGAADPFTAMGSDLVFGVRPGDATLDLTTDPHRVDSITDQSAQSNDASGTGTGVAGRPAHVTPVYGRPRLAFSRDRLAGDASFSGLAAGDGLYVWAVVALTTVSQTQHIFSALSAEGSSTAFHLAATSDGYARFLMGVSSGVAVNVDTAGLSVLVANQMHLIEGWLDDSDSTLRVALDGDAPYTAAAGVSTLPAWGVPTTFSLGDRWSGSSGELEGSVRRVGIMDRTPTSADRAEVLADFLYGLGA